MQIFGHNLTTLEKSLDLRMDEQRVIAANVANIDTPGYTAQRLDFRASMEKALQGAQNPAVIDALPVPSSSLDGNNVDMDHELGQMAQNKIMYSLESQLMGAKFRQLTTMFDQER
jgi:flagellar basal-body rod protein FlgB